MLIHSRKNSLHLKISRAFCTGIEDFTSCRTVRRLPSKTCINLCKPVFPNTENQWKTSNKRRLGNHFVFVSAEIAVTLHRAGITRVEPLEGNGWMVLLLWARASKTGKVSEGIFHRVFGERIEAACGWSTSTSGMARMREECGVRSIMNSEVDAASWLHRLIDALLG
jgi:hypothetical protein